MASRRGGDLMADAGKVCVGGEGGGGQRGLQVGIDLQWPGGGD